MATAAEPELKTYWCHECDMSVSLTSTSPPLLCPHCHTHFLELMDSPFPQNDAVPFPSALSLFDSPFLHRLIQRHLINTTDRNDVVLEDVEDIIHLEDPLALLSPTSKTMSSKKTSLPVITVTSSLLTQLDPNGVVLCAVCKDEIGDGAEGKQLPCKHLYHSDCITPWLELHASCPLCRFQLGEGEEEEDEDDGASRAREIRQQLRAAMLRLSELMEEEEDFYGLRTTLNHIASRHGLIDSNGSRVSEGGDGELESVSVEREAPFESSNGGGEEGGDGQTAVTD